MDQTPPPLPSKPSEPQKGTTRHSKGKVVGVIIAAGCIIGLIALIAGPDNTSRFFRMWKYSPQAFSETFLGKSDTVSEEQNSADDASPVQTIAGTVLSVTDDGVLVEQGGAEYFVNGMRTSTPSSVFFIRGRFDYVDGDRVELKVLPAGTYRYTTAMGSIATVRAYKVRK